MQKNPGIAFIKLVSLLCFITLLISTNVTGKNFRKQDNFPGNFTYLQVFNLADSYNRAADNAQTEQDKLFYKDYFKREANLSDEQDQVLKIISHNFMSAFSLSQGKQKLKNIAFYKNELRQALGVEEFSRFDTYVKKNIASHLKVTRSGDVLTIGGSVITTTRLQQLSRFSFISCRRLECERLAA